MAPLCGSIATVKNSLRRTVSKARRAAQPAVTCQRCTRGRCWTRAVPLSAADRTATTSAALAVVSAVALAAEAIQAKPSGGTSTTRGFRGRLARRRAIPRIPAARSSRIGQQHAAGAGCPGPATACASRVATASSQACGANRMQMRAGRSVWSFLPNPSHTAAGDTPAASLRLRPRLPAKTARASSVSAASATARRWK